MISGGELLQRFHLLQCAKLLRCCCFFSRFRWVHCCYCDVTGSFVWVLTFLRVASALHSLLSSSTLPNAHTPSPRFDQKSIVLCASLDRGATPARSSSSNWALNPTPLVSSLPVPRLISLLRSFIISFHLLNLWWISEFFRVVGQKIDSRPFLSNSFPTP